MRFLISLTAAAVAAATLTATASAASHHALPTKTKLAATRTLAHQVTNLRQGIQHHRSTTWSYQDRRGVRRTPTRYAERRTRSVPFLRWLNRLWWRRQVHAWKHLSTGHLLPWTTDWQTAVNIVQRDWPGSKPWLLACSSSEGGWGLWVPNRQGSGAGGWMQYMEGTFYGDLHGALATARQEHLAVPPRSADRWSSALGQAFAAGWAYLHSRPTGKWTGSRC